MVRKNTMDNVDIKIEIKKGNRPYSMAYYMPGTEQLGFSC